MTSKSTPGPWICYADLPSTEPNWHIVTTANKLRVIANVHIEPGNAMDEANASLIAAAPDLLQALEDLLQAYSEPDRRLCCDGRDCGCMGSTVHQQAEHYARAAIAKAETRP